MKPLLSALSLGFRTWSSMPLVLFVLGFLVLQAAVMAYNTPLSYPPDEMPHLSYVRDSIQSPLALPNYADGRVMGFGQGNYLAHPPLYYSTLGIAGKVFALDPKTHYVVFRLMSVLFVGAGLVFMALAARQLRLEQGAIALTLFACAGIPMFGYLAGSVTNDNMLYLGMAMAFYGLARLVNPDNKDQPWSYALLLGGLLITFLTKATGMAFMVCFFGAWAMLNIRRIRPFALLRDTWPYALAFLVIVGGYYLSTLAMYGALFPKAGTLYEVSGPVAHLDFVGYSQEFFSAMWRRLPVIFSHLSLGPIEDEWLGVFYTMVCLPVVAWVVVRFSSPLLISNRNMVALFDAVALAAIATLTIHLVLGFRTYTKEGLLSGLQPRYYAYLLPLMWFPFFALCMPGWFKQTITALFAASALGVFWASTPFVQSKQLEALQSREQTFAHADRTGLNQQVLKLALREKATGNIDLFSFEPGKLTARGWVFDQSQGVPVQRLWVVAGETFITSVRVQSRRVDVANALGQKQALDSGFSLQLTRLPTGIAMCDLRLLAEFRDGSLAELHNPQCPPAGQ